MKPLMKKQAVPNEKRSNIAINAHTKEALDALKLEYTATHSAVIDALIQFYHENNK